MDETVWQPRPPDPELEAEFLRRLMVKLGVEDSAAQKRCSRRDGKRQERAQLVKGADGARLLRVDDPFDRAWRRVGLALDRVGFTVEDRDRSKGIYFVRYVDPQEGMKKDTGLLSKLAFWRSTDTAKPAAQYRSWSTPRPTRARSAFSARTAVRTAPARRRRSSAFSTIS